MSNLVLTDCFVSFNGTDLSAHVKSVSLDYSAEALDVTAMGDDTHIRLGGLKDWSASVEFHQDYAAGAVDATLFSLVGSTGTLIIRPVESTAVGATNPNFTGTALLESYNPVGGAVGELAAASASFQAAGTLSRATA